MTIFEYVTAALLLILGLGVAELLGDAVNAFRLRHSCRQHWIPLAWAAIIFSHQMQFLWAIFELNVLVEVWSAFRFIVALALALLLFVAGALVIPKPDPGPSWDPWQRFLENGRWSLPVLSIYCLLAFLANPMFFDVGYFESANLPNLALSVLFLGVFFLRSVRSWMLATAICAAISVAAIIRLSPSSYS